MLKGLRDAGVPVTVMENTDTKALVDVVTMSGGDHVIATDYDSVRGLERPVVVWVQGTGNEDRGRLLAMSRCTAQLICVKPPPSRR